MTAKRVLMLCVVFAAAAACNDRTDEPDPEPTTGGEIEREAEEAGEDIGEAADEAADDVDETVDEAQE